MENVTINGQKLKLDYDTPVKLNNGNLVLHYYKGVPIGAYLVTSFRDHKQKYAGEDTSNYCSLINLDNGSIKFEERCSRNTTIKRVLSHLKYGDYAGIKEGQDIKVYHLGDYKIDISLPQKEVVQ